MAGAFQKLKRMLSSSSTPISENALFDPEIGFKVTANESTRELKVIVIGARHLPTLYGLTRADGYIIKVKLFPGREKFETTLKKESWPIFNQEFVFELPAVSRRLDEQLNGRFVVLTVYAILETPRSSGEEAKPSKPKLSSQSFKSFFGKDVKRKESGRADRRISLYKRRTVGAVTYNLDAKAFTQALRSNFLGTPDIWRVIKSISSGLIDNEKNAENCKGSIELTMTYSQSEDGANDMINLTLSRLRFSIKTMESHEHYTGSLYVKMKIFEHDQIVAKRKSDKFEPTISLKLDPTSATMLGTVNRSNLQSTKCEVRLMCRNKLGKKTELGRVEIMAGCGHWENSVDAPCTPVTMWHNFL